MPRRKHERVSGQMDWDLLERILRNYHEFRELYRTHQVEEITVDYVTVNIHDLVEVIDVGIAELPQRQREAVVLMCLEGRREIDVARMMGFERWSSQVGSYKRLGLRKIVKRYWRDDDAVRPGKPAPTIGLPTCSTDPNGAIDSSRDQAAQGLG